MWNTKSVGRACREMRIASIECNVGVTVRELLLGAKVRSPLRLCVMSILLFLTGTMSLAFGADAGANGSCKPSDAGNSGLYSMFTPPNLRLGDFLIELVPPDFRSAALVQEHWKYSTILGDLLMQELPRQTRGLCSANIDATYFPDLYVFLARKNPSEHAEADRFFCSNAVIDAFRKLQPNRAGIERASLRAEEKRSLFLMSQDVGIEALRYLWSSLASFYDKGTVMNALMSVKPADFRSIDADGFISWLARENAVLHERLIPLPMCESDPGARYVSPRGRNLESSVIAPGAVSVVVSKGPPTTRRPLRRIVAVGSNHVVLAPRETSEMTPGCIKEINISTSGRSDANWAAAVPIHCSLWTSPFHLDSWLAFYCDPKDCQSESVEEEVMMAVARDPKVVMLATGNARDLRPRGPYIVNVETVAK